jgi:hypothetical protein
MKKDLAYLVLRNKILLEQTIPFPVFLGFVIPIWLFDPEDKYRSRCSSYENGLFVWQQKDCFLTLDLSHGEM